MSYSSAKFSDLVGKTVVYVEGLGRNSEKVIFIFSDGTKARLIYHQDCCASCSIEDICGNVVDLINSPILKAEEVSSNDNPPGIEVEYQDSFTWTFYHISTARGTVSLRWYGGSNGFYSEKASFEVEVQE